MLTMNVTEFKARCLQLLDKLASHEIEEVTITKRGRVVGVVKAPPTDTETWAEWRASMRGRVIMEEGFDPTAPACD